MYLLDGIHYSRLGHTIGAFDLHLITIYMVVLVVAALMVMSVVALGGLWKM